MAGGNSIEMKQLFIFCIVLATIAILLGILNSFFPNLIPNVDYIVNLLFTTAVILAGVGLILRVIKEIFEKGG